MSGRQCYDGSEKQGCGRQTDTNHGRIDNNGYDNDLKNKNAPNFDN